LNVGFVEFLLDGVETGLPSDEEDDVPDVFVKLILAFNLHFELPEENMVMKALASRGTAKTFTEKLLLLVNREGSSCYSSSRGFPRRKLRKKFILTLS